MTRLYPQLELPQSLPELTARKWENGPWNWRLISPKTTKMMLVWPLMTNLNITVKDDYADSTWHPPPPTLSIKALTPCLSGLGWVGLWTDTTPLQFLASEIKQTFLPTNPVYWVLSIKQPYPPHFSICLSLSDLFQ